ncbi:DNA-directed RNA polymerase subunit D [Natronobacterium gregoryi]|uniref:DNA-directed RNA polymerase subunit Rpo3 n=2 Tax=Natronobacterium gregoryi TaxID=44930 RepID=L0AKZ1_NATGS|nr:DNA-directed RNA polymerase subunit D [Natronobacterium gregoryi]AFZ73710.1 DNA-directed RNA polymerase, alpha subunit/40 kD subunit [Natronobacterium gregoryi SP2]ELY67670.1 DNA-directed RNA polymerase subunit D [Natronobacterium gregoryi SP2]PLK19578.1 DNA-directed RNA polymerase subunit D [Natronobacterium gregoryi SP2]SFJ01721.1 DNA-directed RNA polymerase, subunit D [Natronobacterium gregoryi]
MTEEYDVEFVERDDRNARFLVRNVTPAFANGIRRAMLADVPTMAIDTVRFVENSSVMFDEQLALRLGLVPLTTPPEGEFGEDDTVTLSIDVEGPATAYSGDLVSSDDLVQPADENVPIIELKDGQRLEAEAEATLDRGKEHAKHQGGVAVGYRHLQHVEVVGDVPEFEEEGSRIVRGVIEDDGELVSTTEFDHDLSNRYPGKEVEIEDVPNAFVFHVETDGSFPIEELVTRAADTIEARATELEDAVQL